MAFKIITAEERMQAQPYVKGVIYGPHGVGKTSLLKTMNPKKVLFINLEAGEKSVQDFPCASIEVNSWMDAVNIACLASGPDESLHQHQDGTWPTFSSAHYDYLVQENPDMPAYLAQFETHFWDSISVASRMAWKWALGQPGSFSEKTGKQDTRGTYRIIGQDLIAWLTRIQHTKGKNIWVVGGLDAVKDDFGRATWSPQIEGAKAGREMLGIFDEVISMVIMKGEDGSNYRAFVCRTENPWGYPAKDRLGKLEMVEEPHLGKLMEKLNTRPTITTDHYQYNLPVAPATENEE